MRKLSFRINRLGQLFQVILIAQADNELKEFLNFYFTTENSDEELYDFTKILVSYFSQIIMPNPNKMLNDMRITPEMTIKLMRDHNLIAIKASTPKNFKEAKEFYGEVQIAE